MQNTTNFYRNFNKFPLIIALLLFVFISVLLFNTETVAHEKIPSDCYYAGPEYLDNGIKICHYDCDERTKKITIKEAQECPDPEED